jgi:hypothetical protein
MDLLGSNSDDLVLEEGDIPGAKLQKPVEQCTVAVLKRRLSCRGANVIHRGSKWWCKFGKEKT